MNSSKNQDDPQLELVTFAVSGLRPYLFSLRSRVMDTFDLMNVKFDLLSR